MHMSNVFREGLLEGRVALVTGGGTNLGRAAASELVACGASVVIAGRTEETLAAAASEIGCSYVVGDIREAGGAAAIAAAAGVELAEPARVLVLPLPLDQVDGPYGREKLAPLVSLFTVEGEEQGLTVCRRLLANQGAGHTAVIHTGDERLQQRFAREVPASRILVNGPATHGCIGIGNGLVPSLTLGCGTFGGNSTTDNVTYTNLLNIKRLARPS